MYKFVCVPKRNAYEYTDHVLPITCIDMYSKVQIAHIFPKKQQKMKKKIIF